MKKTIWIALAVVLVVIGIIAAFIYARDIVRTCRQLRSDVDLAANGDVLMRVKSMKMTVPHAHITVKAGKTSVDSKGNMTLDVSNMTMAMGDAIEMAMVFGEDKGEKIPMKYLSKCRILALVGY
ncbi:MAG: hypothetical protein ORN57_00360 [Alphaproteobacteria bacterium]|nr:hypothetical protein [Alphaproteobacteria bacterium]